MSVCVCVCGQGYSRWRQSGEVYRENGGGSKSKVQRREGGQIESVRE